MKVKKNGVTGEELKNARRCVISVKNKKGPEPATPGLS